MGLTCTVLGCSGSYAAAGGACTGYLVRSDAAAVWLDAGPGTLANLQRHLPLAALDAVVITHEHPDHWLELPVVASALRYYQRRDRLPLYTTQGTARLVVELCEGPAEPIPFDIHVVADGDEIEIGDQRWRFSRTDHYVETLAIRSDAAGRSLAFSADTGPGWAMASLGEGIDLALCESTFLHRRSDEGILHLSARQAGETAADAGVGRLVLTHLTPGDDPDPYVAEAAEAFGRDVELACIDAVYEV